jgi:hypothetical protein
MINHHLPKPQPSPSSPPYSPANPHKNYRLLIYNHRLYGDASLPFAGSHDAAALKPMGSLQARGGPPRKRSPAIGHRRSTGRGSSGNPKSRLDGRRRSAANGDAGMGKDRLGGVACSSGGLSGRSRPGTRCRTLRFSVGTGDGGRIPANRKISSVRVSLGTEQKLQIRKAIGSDSVNEGPVSRSCRRTIGGMLARRKTGIDAVAMGWSLAGLGRQGDYRRWGDWGWGPDWPKYWGWGISCELAGQWPCSEGIRPARTASDSSRASIGRRWPKGGRSQGSAWSCCVSIAQLSQLAASPTMMLNHQL